MNWPLLIAGGLTALAALVHALAGERTDIRHLLASDVPTNEKLELRGVWHTFSIALAGSAFIAFYSVLVQQTMLLNDLLRGLALFYLLCGTMVFLLILGTERRFLLKVPQWLLLLVIGGLMWWGSV
ncbi:MAG: hypothetical protein AAF702_05335 [Chloroflexota bacterium]